MIARLYISTPLTKLQTEISKTLASHIGSGNVVHPDILYFKQGEKLGIDQAKKIKGHFSLKPSSAKGRAVVIEDASVLTIEAQNALLKTLEELPQNGLLILGASSAANLLPTILSRCQITRIKNNEPKIINDGSDIEKLLSSTVVEKFKYIEKIKDKEKLLQSLLQYFHHHLMQYPQFTKELLQAEEQVKQNVNIRAVLEYLMLVMPKESSD